MADKKISQLSDASTPLAGTETLPTVQGGSTVKVTAANLTAGRAVSMASANVTGSVAPANGAFLPAANEVGISTNGAEKVRVTSGGHLLVGATTNPGALNVSLVVDSGAASLCGIVLQNDATGRTFSDGGQIFMVGAELRISNAENNILMFQTNGTDRGRFEAAGDFRVESGDIKMQGAGKGLNFAGNGGVIWRTGAGTPEGAVTAPVGSLFTRTDGGANTTLYVKESGTGNTGWVAK
jgi:hypothetical protein